MASNKKKTPAVNASSMADIAFLLLIFFLVATTMNVDSGINRVLPPWSESTEAPDIKERNLLEVKVNKFDQIQVRQQAVSLAQLKDVAKDYVLNRAELEDYPEKEMTEVEFFGMYPVSMGVISLQNDRGTSYDMYINVQNELTRAFNELRDELSIERFGMTFNELDEARRKAVQKAIPSKISEAEPVNVGG